MQEAADARRALDDLRRSHDGDSVIHTPSHHARNAPRRQPCSYDRAQTGHCPAYTGADDSECLPRSTCANEGRQRHCTFARSPDSAVARRGRRGARGGDMLSVDTHAVDTRALASFVEQNQRRCLASMSPAASAAEQYRQAKRQQRTASRSQRSGQRRHRSLPGRATASAGHHHQHHHHHEQLEDPGLPVTGTITGANSQSTAFRSTGPAERLQEDNYRQGARKVGRAHAVGNWHRGAAELRPYDLAGDRHRGAAVIKRLAATKRRALASARQGEHAPAAFRNFCEDIAATRYLADFCNDAQSATGADAADAADQKQLAARLGQQRAVNRSPAPSTQNRSATRTVTHGSGQRQQESQPQRAMAADDTALEVSAPTSGSARSAVSSAPCSAAPLPLHVPQEWPDSASHTASHTASHIASHRELAPQGCCGDAVCRCSVCEQRSRVETRVAELHDRIAGLKEQAAHSLGATLPDPLLSKRDGTYRGNSGRARLPTRGLSTPPSTRSWGTWQGERREHNPGGSANTISTPPERAREWPERAHEWPAHSSGDGERPAGHNPMQGLAIVEAIKEQVSSLVAAVGQQLGDAGVLPSDWRPDVKPRVLHHARKAAEQRSLSTAEHLRCLRAEHLAECETSGRAAIDSCRQSRLDLQGRTRPADDARHQRPATSDMWPQLQEYSERDDQQWRRNALNSSAPHSSLSLDKSGQLGMLYNTGALRDSAAAVEERLARRRADRENGSAAVEARLAQRRGRGDAGVMGVPAAHWTRSVSASQALGGAVGSGARSDGGVRSSGGSGSTMAQRQDRLADLVQRCRRFRETHRAADLEGAVESLCVPISRDTV